MDVRSLTSVGGRASCEDADSGDSETAVGGAADGRWVGSGITFLGEAGTNIPCRSSKSERRMYLRLLLLQRERLCECRITRLRRRNRIVARLRTDLPADLDHDRPAVLSHCEKFRVCRVVGCPLPRQHKLEFLC